MLVAAYNWQSLSSEGTPVSTMPWLVFVVFRSFPAATNSGVTFIRTTPSCADEVVWLQACREARESRAATSGVPYQVEIFIVDGLGFQFFRVLRFTFGDVVPAQSIQEFEKGIVLFFPLLNESPDQFFIFI